MILLTLTQQLIAQSFLGGSGQELARFYLLAAKRSVVTSERAVKGYGAQRFAIGEKDKLIYPEGTFLRITHNSPILNLGPDPKGPPTQRQFPNVDCLSVTFMPLAIAGLTTLDSEAQYRELATNTSTLQLTRASPFTKALIGKGSDSIGNLVNDGLTKPITFPTLLGKIWFSCSMVQVSEIDFLNAVAQVADCKLVDKADVYEFVPNIEQVRARLLNSYKLFGDPNDTFEGLRQRCVYRAYEIATTGTIAESISNEKMDKVVSIPDDVEFKNCVKKLMAAAIKKYGAIS